MPSENDLLHDAVSGLLSPHRRRHAAAELQADLRGYPLTVTPALRSCRRTIYTTKGSWLMSLTQGTLDLPDDVAIFSRFGPLDGPQRALVRAVVQSVGAPMYFIGDLDPLDLVTYATLAEPGESAIATAEYLGVADPWLERCERDLLSQGRTSMQQVCIPMDSEEREGFELLKQVPIDWGGLIGPRALSMLESGMKLELEGATNPHIYSGSFCDEILRFIFG
jgi:hypothetical protein